MGFWQDNHRHGDGFVITVDGVYYEGTFNQDKLQVRISTSSFMLKQFVVWAVPGSLTIRYS